MTKGSRIKRLRESMGISQTELADMIGVSKQTMYKYENDIVTNIPSDKIELIADITQSTPEYIMGWQKIEENVTNLSYPAARPLPILGTICAGNGVFCEENYNGYFFVDNSIKADLCLTVRGDSMTGLGICPKDIAFIKRVDSVVNGKVYAVRINDDTEAVLKSVYITGKKVVLNSANTDYAPIITDIKHISIIGVLVGVYHPLK